MNGTHSSNSSLLQLNAVSKRFGEVNACSAVSFEVLAGQMHALLGENGAGKSTLIALMSGQLRPDSGEVVAADGTHIESAADAAAAQIRVVTQHSALIAELTLGENLMLSQHRVLIDNAAARGELERLNDVFDTAFGFDDLAGELTVGEQRQFDIARVVSAEAQLYVLDEPTALLDEVSAKRLFARLREHVARSRSVLLVTHHLREVVDTCDRATVLRAGKVVAQFDNVTSHSEVQLVAAMFGDGDVAGGKGAAHGDAGRDAGEVLVRDPLESVGSLRPTLSNLSPTGRMRHELLSERGLDPHLRRIDEADRTSHTPHPNAALHVSRVSTSSPEPQLHNIGFTLQRGEILGVAGIEGNGQRQLIDVLSGQLAAEAGSITLDGTDITRRSVAARSNAGLATLTDDRLGEGLIGSLSIADNLNLKRFGAEPLLRMTRISKPQLLRDARELIEQFGIRPANPDAQVGTLSGGNMQKVLVARELGAHPQVLLCHNPTHGLDRQTAQRVRAELVEATAQGTSVLLVTSDIDELLQLAHRVTVMRDGTLTAPTINDPQANMRERIGQLIARSEKASS